MADRPIPRRAREYALDQPEFVSNAEESAFQCARIGKQGFMTVEQLPIASADAAPASSVVPCLDTRQLAIGGDLNDGLRNSWRAFVVVVAVMILVHMLLA